MVVASRLPYYQAATHIASSTTSGAGTITEPHSVGKSAGVNNNSDSRPGPVSLLEKYTFRETVRTMIEEDDLPELPDFLESINLGDRLDVSSGATMVLQASDLGKVCTRGLDVHGTIQAHGIEPTIRHNGGDAMIQAREWFVPDF